MEKIDDYVKRSEVLALEKEVYVKEVDYRIRCIDASAVESLEGYVLTAETEAEIRKAVRVIIREAKRLTEAILQNLSKLAERKNGKWIYCEDSMANCADGYKCDQCGFFVPWDYQHKGIDYINDYHYCPNCGARMDGGAEE